jgi:hypothetical protein
LGYPVSSTIGNEIVGTAFRLFTNAYKEVFCKFVLDKEKRKVISEPLF